MDHDDCISNKIMTSNKNDFSKYRDDVVGEKNTIGPSLFLLVSKIIGLRST